MKYLIIILTFKFINGKLNNFSPDQDQVVLYREIKVKTKDLNQERAEIISNLNQQKLMKIYLVTKIK